VEAGGAAGDAGVGSRNGQEALKRASPGANREGAWSQAAERAVEGACREAKEQAGSIDPGMEAWRAGSRCGRAKGRSEHPAQV